MATRNILVLGASYGCLLGVKLALAGHDVRLVCRARNAALINDRGVVVRLPVKGREGLVEVRSGELPGRITASVPEAVDPGSFDMVVLAMQEPQYRLPGVRELLQATAASGVPCLSVMNMPPPPYLSRIPGIDPGACAESYTDASPWEGFDARRVTLCSPDPQAFRPPEEEGNVLQVRLATNFKAAAFELGRDTALLRELASGIEQARYEHGGERLDLPVKLKVHDSVFVPLAKWAMLLAGNYRCLTDDGVRSIAEAVHSDAESSRAVYDWVGALCVSLGADPGAMVPFDKYAQAARSLQSPSSAARALAAGVPHIERVDRLVQAVAAQKGLAHPSVDETVARVDDWLVRNRLKG
ncbi:MAG TPA: 2-dehydropantoate 2-reductase N-terminal domain-containing protein [Usitatibacter sp.]|nr:2-dehydropantoate 2-reductase N-terminal domain-containing protein [Usitatibacter sp.]